MATTGKKPRDLLAERILRLERQGAETNQRLDRVETILGGIANILAGQGKELERHSQLLERHSQLLERHSQLLQALVDRFDRFADAVTIGRTRDTERVRELERRVETLERQVFGETPPSRNEPTHCVVLLPSVACEWLQNRVDSHGPPCGCVLHACQLGSRINPP